VEKAIAVEEPMLEEAVALGMVLDLAVAVLFGGEEMPEGSTLEIHPGRIHGTIQVATQEEAVTSNEQLGIVTEDGQLRLGVGR
jgi:hypothetical protein